MNKYELISKQQLEIENYKKQITKNKEIINKLHPLFYGTGQPLNDNRLKLNNEQLSWVLSVYNLIDQIY